MNVSFFYDEENYGLGPSFRWDDNPFYLPDFLFTRHSCHQKGRECVTKKPTNLPTLEESLAEITQLIDKMEHGEQTLEQSLTNFERGITLVKHCQKVLQEAEQKVQILIQNNNQEELTAFSNEDGDNNASN